MGDTFACEKERLKNMAEIFIEAENFKNLGGWVIDQQSMETIHSSYIMAHGMGVPVADAVHEFTVNTSGEYTVWALTRDWTAVWNVKDSAGKFKIGINGKNVGNESFSGKFAFDAPTPPCVERVAAYNMTLSRIARNRKRFSRSRR